MLEKFFDMIDWIFNRPFKHGLGFPMTEEEAWELYNENPEHSEVRYRMATDSYLVYVYPRRIRES
jgi:hypothetical protein